VRYPWAEDYRGAATVLYGHTPVPEAEWINNTMCLDTGCVFGGALTALRYPERELVAVPAGRVYYEPARPFLPAEGLPPPAEPERREPGLLDVADVLGKRVVHTAHHGRIGVREEQAAGALEVMSRFALAPQWLPYLPPTMAPCAASTRPDVLEHPEARSPATAPMVSVRSCARRSTWGRVRSSCSAGTQRRRPPGSGPPAGPGPSTRVPAVRSSTAR